DGDGFFTALGFHYFGPIDGHELHSLEKTLRLVKEFDGPAVVHVLTRKGYGYPKAEALPEQFHGTPPFYVETGDPRKASNLPSFGQVMARELADMAKTDRRIVTITAAMPGGTGLNLFQAEHPDRMLDVGIAEEHAVTLAAGLAAGGMKPYFAVYASFFQRSFDQMIHDVCMQKLPVTFLLDRAGLVGADGATHNGLMDLSYLRSIPNMTIAAPRDIRALRRLLYWSRTYEAPLAIRYPKEVLDLGEGLDRREEICPGRWETLLEGEVTLLAVGRMVQTALMAAMALHERGISAGVVDAMFVKPMDENLLRRLAEKSPLLVTLEENTLPGGFGEGVLGELEKMGMTANVVSLGVADRYVAHASLQEQLEMCGLTPQAVAEAVEKRLAQSHERSTYGGQKAQG
ncbi:MAG: transketolase C-terminal domain-containing protein, partial [Eubacteriales bacterium]|nr:transketolase C-terminal domain-containing protein [Eubacteriales bacterium]